MGFVKNIQGPLTVGKLARGMIQAQRGQAGGSITPSLVTQNYSPPSPPSMINSKSLY